MSYVWIMGCILGIEYTNSILVGYGLHAQERNAPRYGVCQTYIGAGVGLPGWYGGGGPPQGEKQAGGCQPS